MNVALLTPAYWPEVQRGTERIVHDLAAGLAARGHRPRVITSHRGRRRTALEDGFEVVRNRRPPEPLIARLGIQDGVSHLAFTGRSLARGDDELAHAFALPDAATAAGWAQRKGRPFVWSYMGIPTAGTLRARRGRARLLGAVREAGGTVVGLSHAACDALREQWGIEARLVYPGVDLSAFDNDPGERDEQPAIACAASPDDDRKRVPLLVDAFAQVRSKQPDARLLLVRPRDRRVAGELERTAGVELHDESPDLSARLFARSWASALTSYDEAFGLVVVESLAAGRPVVAAAEGGPAEILGSGTGIGALFGTPSAERVAAALFEALDLAADPGVAARCRARAIHFTQEASVARTEELYRELIAQGTGSKPKTRP